MEPKSIAFYTAVAVSILAVLSATTFSATTLPAMAQANTGSSTATTMSQEENNNVDESSGSEQSSEDAAAASEDAAAASEDAAAASEDAAENEDAAANEGMASRSLSLEPSNSVLSCGETIDHSVQLTTDMENCPQGFTVTGEDTVFDLNGHTISSGSAGDSSAGQLGSAGITVANAVDAQIIGMGGIEGYDAGIRVLASENTQIEDVQVADNGIGVDMIGATGADVSRSSLTNNVIGVQAVQSSDVILAFDQVVANMETGISYEGVTGGVIAANSVFGNGGDEGSGIYLDPNTKNVNVDYNSAWANGLDINHADGLSTSITGNTFGPNNNCGTSIPAGLCNGQTGQTTEET
jgi:nitrous oxidase accessory protein NosD